MKYISVCSGIEAATVAWHPLGWEPLAFSEIDKFPRAVLAHHYPDVPIHGDFTTMKGDEYGRADLLVGGTPCQSFSIAGLRGGLADDRGNLALEYLRLAARGGFRWTIWENVPGVLSSNGGRDFGTFLAALAELGYGWAYRILDAQYFGVAQRRRRVFVVGHLGDWRRAAAVLFERESMSGNPAPRREAREDVARWPADCAPTLNATFGEKQGLENQHALSGAGLFVPAAAFGINDVAHCLRSGASKADKPDSTTYVASFAETARTLSARHDGSPCADRGPDVIATQSAVRRLTPLECERLQGFPDSYTDIPYRGKSAPDGPRYKALGNSMAVPVMRWIGQRIQNVEKNPHTRPDRREAVA